MWRDTAAGFEFLAEVEEQATVAETLEVLRQSAACLPIAAVFCGLDTGVMLADVLAQHLQLRGNRPMARGDKQVQQDAVKAANLRSTRSVKGTDWNSVKAFAETEGFPIIIKPAEAAGSYGVKLCHNACEAETHFRQLSWQLQGRRNREVLLQEYLKGAQYVVDHVSRDGVHKTTMVWDCDRGPFNGGYVCFQQQCVAADTAVARQLIAYTRACLDALSITEGATHAEVMMTETGPCLVEVNLRCHGAGGVWMPVARAFAGYTQVDAYVDALGDGASPFEQLPDVPPSGSKGSGLLLPLLAYHDGHVGSTHFEKVRELQSVLLVKECVHPGTRVEKTRDDLGLVGLCALWHRDPAVLASDVEAIREMDQKGSILVLHNEAT